MCNVIESSKGKEPAATLGRSPAPSPRKPLAQNNKR